jgi:hypothetical protein
LNAAASGILSNTATVTPPAGVTDGNVNNSFTDADTITAAAPAPTLNYPNGFAGRGQFKFNGATAVVGSNLQLTDGGTGGQHLRMQAPST